MAFILVALFTGAWIEIKEEYGEVKEKQTSRSLRARGLKSDINIDLTNCRISRALYGRVDGNTEDIVILVFVIPVALFTGAWIEIMVLKA